MMDLIEGFVSSLSEGNLLAALLVGIPLIVALFRLLYSLIIEIKERKNNDLKGALEIDGLSDDVRFVIQESLNRTYFYRATGIASDNYIRSRIRQFLETTKGDITLHSIRRSSEYIQIEGGKLTIKFGRFDKLEYYWQIGSSIVLSLVYLFGYALLAAKWGVEEEGKITLAVVSSLGLILSVYSVWKVSSFKIAKNIIKPAFKRF